MNKIRKGDQVIVRAGKDKGNKGVVLKVIIASDKVIVENINMAKCHVKGNPSKNEPGGIIEKEKSIHISNVSLLNPVTDKADRVGFRFIKDGERNRKVRYFKSNNEVVDI